ncbi:Chaperone_protein DnaK [Hexamita inflata]|uniref:Chaperone protein DnaK n=1 Tax=Hexamita inflata TaxID=28002 RepID=A0AA86N423_9EUKA|nr:Chaperone protein DnaK [Hexamita inflata]
MKSIGIDLGTCNSCVAEFKDGVSRALVNTVSNKLTTPSVITYPSLSIGQSEKDAPTQNQTISSFKRLIGRRFTDQEVQEQIKRVDYKIVNQNDQPMVKLLDQVLSPSQISGDFLKQLAMQTSINQNKVVLTVPAYFSHQQKLQTEKAGQIAGLDISRLLAEPTAAALQYDIQSKNKQQNELVMVVDLGAGTFDVSVLEKSGEIYTVLAAAGNNFYGGDDYTTAVKKALADINIEATFKEAEDLKHLLSQAETVEFKNQQISHQHIAQQFNALDERLTKPILQTLSDANLKPEQINKILLVGGQTKQPSVQNKIQLLMNKKPLTDLNPDTCVAQGAAVQAAILNKQISSVLLLDATPFSLGIETFGNAFSKVINRNVTLPAKQSQIFTTTEDNQDSVSIKIYQGENQLAMQNVFLGEFILNDIQKAPRGVPRIQVEFEIDQNGVVNVTALDQKSGQKQNVQVKFGEQRTQQVSERDILIAKLNQKNVKLNGKETLQKLKALLDKAERRSKQ